MSDDTAPAVVGGVIIGLCLGAGLTLLVMGHNLQYDEVQARKQLVELGVGSYDSRTGSFQVKGCNR